MLQPIVRSKSLGDELRKLGVALVEPSSGSDSVGDVGELVSSEELHEVASGHETRERRKKNQSRVRRRREERHESLNSREELSLNELGMKSSDSVDLVRSNDGKVGHSNGLRETFLDEGHSLHLLKPKQRNEKRIRKSKVSSTRLLSSFARSRRSKERDIGRTFPISPG